MQQIDCYTDASYSKDVRGSYIGYIIDNNEVKLQFLEGVKNSEAEEIAAALCIEIAKSRYPDYIINLYTDCQKVVNNTNINNVKVHKMIGHMKGNNDIHQTRFKVVDKATRKALRQKRKEIII